MFSSSNGCLPFSSDKTSLILKKKEEKKRKLRGYLNEIDFISQSKIVFFRKFCCNCDCDVHCQLKRGKRENKPFI
jgi:hypothetical protein